MVGIFTSFNKKSQIHTMINNKRIILAQGGKFTDERNNDFDFDFMPIGQAIKKLVKQEE